MNFLCVPPIIFCKRAVFSWILAIFWKHLPIFSSSKVMAVEWSHLLCDFEVYTTSTHPPKHKSIIWQHEAIGKCVFYWPHHYQDNGRLRNLLLERLKFNVIIVATFRQFSHVFANSRINSLITHCVGLEEQTGKVKKSANHNIDV